MSKFLTKHPMLAIAFKGAAQNIISQRSLLKDGYTIGAILVVSALAATALLPYTALFAATLVAVDAGVGARWAYKAEKNRRKPLSDCQLSCIKTQRDTEERLERALALVEEKFGLPKARPTARNPVPK